MAEGIDISIEHRNLPEPSQNEKPHANSCPERGTHYRAGCGIFENGIAALADEGTFKEEAADLRSEDPLTFFDMRPYTERLVEAEQETGQGDAMVIGSAAIERVRCELAVMDFAFMGGSMGSVVGEKFARACESSVAICGPLRPAAVPTMIGTAMTPPNIERMCWVP